MKKLLITLLLTASCLPAGAADLVNSIRTQLVQPAVLRGQFEQNKLVNGFKKPLRSSGDFLVARNRGVLWNTRAPFSSQLRLTRNEIVATQDGQIAFRLNASKEPSVRMINSLMFSLLSGEVGELQRQFRLSGSSSPTGWKLQLIPLQAGLAKVMSQITLSGDKFVRNIEISEASGDKTRIHFLAQTTTQNRLTPQEDALLD
jgi:hypothetical protein